MYTVITLCFLLLATVLQSSKSRPTEEERVRLWHEKNVWPPKWQEDTPEYIEVMEQREREIMQIPGADERWENWMQYVQGRMLPRFTHQGFDVIKTPAHVQKKLKDAVMEGVKNWENLREEQQVEDSIYGSKNPKFVDLGPLAQEVIKELRPLHEQWVDGMKLKATSAYGVRLYRNGSSMVMHNDKPHTHVISSIVHIAHEYDNDDEPWTIDIEDHNGKLHSVALAEGEMLFYESAKCLHGRMTQLKGKYYGSIFLHYQPIDRKIWSYSVDEDIIASVPPHWRDGITEEHGSRWAGQAITVDSRVVANAPPRVTGVEKPAFQYEEESPEDEYRNNIYEDSDNGEL